jgi:hypothetical protein
MPKLKIFNHSPTRTLQPETRNPQLATLYQMTDDKLQIVIAGNQIAG